MIQPPVWTLSSGRWPIPLGGPLRRCRQVRGDHRAGADARSDVTQGAISRRLRSLKQAGLVAERREGRDVFYRAEPKGLPPLVDSMGRYGVFWRPAFRRSSQSPERSFHERRRIQDRYTTDHGGRGLSSRPGNDLEALTTGNLISRWRSLPPVSSRRKAGSSRSRLKAAGAWDGTITARCWK